MGQIMASDIGRYVPYSFAKVWRQNHRTGENSGVIVPSVVKRGLRNINVFPANFRRGDRLTIRGADKLPPPGCAGF